MAIILMRDPDWFGDASVYEPYWQSLGRFVHRFAILEQEISATLQLYTRTSDEIARATFDGVRAKAALDTVKRIREVTGLKPDPDYDRALAQFSTINGVRNDLMHFGALLYGNGFRVSNEFRVVPSKRRVTPISADDLDAMTADLDIIFATLFVMQCEADGTDVSAYKTDFRELGRSAWRYKSRAQGGPPQTPRAPSPKHERQRRSLKA